MYAVAVICCVPEIFFEIYPDGRIPVYPVGQNFQMLLPFMYRYKCPTIEKELYGVAVRRGSHSRQILTREETEETRLLLFYIFPQFKDLIKRQPLDDIGNFTYRIAFLEHFHSHFFFRAFRFLFCICKLFFFK